MTKEEEIKKYAEELGQKYFPDSRNIWARPNIEAKCIEYACIEMAIWMDKHYSLNLIYQKLISNNDENNAKNNDDI